MSGIRDAFRGFPSSEPGTAGDPGLFGPGTVSWAVNGEAAMILGGGRALLMQIAHPLVAAGVAQHSDFRRNPFERLWRTLGAMLEICYGDDEQWRAAAARVTAVHETVSGTAAGGAAYRALDPELLMWVHATLVDTALVTYERFVAPLTREERERYYLEMKRQALVLRVPEEALPGTLEAFERYTAAMIPQLVVSDDARALARDVVSPRAPVLLKPLTAWLRAITTSLLPEELREGFGMRLTRAHELVTDASSRVLRRALPFAPDVMRRWPHTREAERRTATVRSAALA